VGDSNAAGVGYGDRVGEGYGDSAGLASNVSPTRLATAGPIGVCLTPAKRRACPAGCLVPFCQIEFMLDRDDARWGGLGPLAGNAFDESLCRRFINW